MGTRDLSQLHQALQAEAARLQAFIDAHAEDEDPEVRGVVAIYREAVMDAWAQIGNARSPAGAAQPL